MERESRHTATAAAVWGWRQGGAASAPARPWRRAAVAAAIGLAVAAVLAFAGRTVAATVVAAVAGVSFACAIAAPRAYRALDAVLVRFGTIVGVVLAWVLLVPFFYLVFPAGRLAFRLRGRDPLERRVPTDLPTYWQPREPYEDAEAHCRRQYS